MTGDEVEVRREDQDKINKFSRLHQRELKLEDDLKAKNVRRTLVPCYAPIQRRTPLSSRREWLTASIT